MLVETNVDNAPSRRTCQEWFRRYKPGDYDNNDKGRPGELKKFED